MQIKIIYSLYLCYFQVEVTVDKAIKTLHDKKNELLRAKKSTHTKAKESEHMAVQLEDPTQRGKILSDKEVNKVSVILQIVHSDGWWCIERVCVYASFQQNFCSDMTSYK